MIVENKHTSLYWNGTQIPLGVSNLEDSIASHYIERGLLKEVVTQELVVATPKKKSKPKAKKKEEQQVSNEQPQEINNELDL